MNAVIKKPFKIEFESAPNETRLDQALKLNAEKDLMGSLDNIHLRGIIYEPSFRRVEITGITLLVKKTGNQYDVRPKDLSLKYPQVKEVECIHDDEADPEDNTRLEDKTEVGVGIIRVNNNTFYLHTK